MPNAAPSLTFTTNPVGRQYFDSDPIGTEWWAEQDGTPVAYMKTLTYPDERYCGARLVLCDIEVRDGHRGQGLVSVLVEHAQATTGLVLHTTGGYTPEGAAALMGRLAVLPGHTEKVAWESMTFVQDWDAKHGPRY